MSNATVSKSVLVYRRRRAEFIAERGDACENCGSSDRLEIDHIERANKTMPATDAFQRRKEIRVAELAKCQVLCSRCHRDKTVREQTGPDHGTQNTYVRGCRCSACKAAHAELARSYRANRNS